MLTAPDTPEDTPTVEKTAPAGRAVKRARLLSILALGLIGLIVIGVVLFAQCVRPDPPPRVAFDAGEVAAYIAREEAKARAFVPDEAEVEVIKAIKKFQADEGAGYPVVLEEDVRFHERQVGDALERLAQESGRDRVLALGDYLAQGCMEALASASEDTKTSEACGSLLFHAFRSGLIDKQGRVHGPSHLLRVLFKVRWRGLVPQTDPLFGLSRIERLAYYDFVLAFIPARKADRKLAAIREIQRLVPSYPSERAIQYVTWAKGRPEERR